jgi:hypothetical protein
MSTLHFDLQLGPNQYVHFVGTAADIVASLARDAERVGYPMMSVDEYMAQMAREYQESGSGELRADSPEAFLGSLVAVGHACWGKPPTPAA